MEKLDVLFLQQYIKLDNLMKKLLSSQQGVNDYLEAMEDEFQDATFLNVLHWDSDYQTLIHLRLLHKQITHEGELLGLCDEMDLDVLKALYARLIQQDDPLSRLALARQCEAQKQSQYLLHESETNYQSQDLHRWLWILLFFLILCCLIFLFLYVYR